MKAWWLTYEFDVYSYYGSWTDVGGVYMMTGLNSLNQWVPLYAGKADNFRKRMSGHEKWNPAVQLGATHVHAMVVELEFLRNWIEHELIRVYDPPLNKQLPANPYAWKTPSF